MIYRNAAPVGPARRTLAAFARTAAIGVALSVAATSFALAQAPAPAPAPAPTPAAKPKPPTPAKKPAPAPGAQTSPPATAQQAPPPPPQQGPPGSEQQPPPLIYSPWTKFCAAEQQNSDKKVCFTAKDSRIESGLLVAGVVLIEAEGESKRILRVTFPLGMEIMHGTRVLIDQNPPLTAPFVVCIPNGCMADYDATAPDLLDKMKKGQTLVVQAINAMNNQPLSVPMPLADFAKAYDGPPTDPQAFKEQQDKLQAELQRRADEARKKLESQQGTPPPAPAPQPKAP